MAEDVSASPATADTEPDPHTPKIDPSDPRLRIARPRSRSLKTKPIIACAAAALGLAAYAIVLRVGKPANKVAIAQEPPKIPSRPPGVPDFIAQEPSVPTPPAPPPAPRFVAAHSPFQASPPPVQPQPAPVVPRVPSRAEQLAEQARESGLVFQTTTRPEAAPAGLPPSNPMASPNAPSPLNPGLAAAVATAAGAGAQWDPNLQARKNSFLDDPRAAPDYLPHALEAPRSPHELKATAIIPVTLITGINSDLPGPIIAQVRERVFDTVTGRELLIPQGARLLATYDSMVAWGQERVLLCWNRLIFPNGKSIQLDCMPAADLQGQAGLADEVDQHWGRLFAAAGLATVLSLGTQATAGNTSGYQPTIAQTAARSAAGEISTIGQSVVQRQINIQPTITVRPGFGCNVIVTKDLVLEPYVD